MDVILTIIVYFTLMNIAGFASMGIDKQKAKKGAFRIPESALFTLALFGGSLGSTAGMFLFHHKTRHWYFRYGMPLILFVQLLIIFWLHRAPITFTIF